MTLNFNYLEWKDSTWAVIMLGTIVGCVFYLGFYLGGIL